MKTIYNFRLQDRNVLASVLLLMLYNDKETDLDKRRELITF